MGQTTERITELNEVAGFYRVTFDNKRRNYWTQFDTGINDLYPSIRRILDEAGEYGVQDIWWFFEPYAEVTWFAEDNSFMERVLELLAEDGFHDRDIREFTPNDGVFFNWYGHSEDEVAASGRTYAEIRKVSQVLIDNREILEGGLGMSNHYQRSLHVLANQLGMNYFDEGIASLKHGALCLAMFFLNPSAIAHVCRRFKIKSGLTA